MKNILLLAAFLLGATAAEAHLAQEPVTSKASKKAARKARRQNGPEVYKGSVAEQRRIVTEAAGAERDDNTGDDTSTKKNKRKNK